MPYPGSFVIDEDGILVGKRIEQSHRTRPTANTMMNAFFASDDEPEGLVSSSTPGVQVAAWLDTSVVAANQMQDAHVRFVLEPDVHLYTDPVPEGFRAVKVSLVGDDSIYAHDYPPLEGHDFSVTGIDETFSVLEGTIDVAIPFFLLSNRDTAGDALRSVPLSVEVAYQACTGDECFMPESVTLELDLSEAANPGYETKDLAALAPLVTRRIVEGPKTDEELLELVNAALTGVDVDATEVAATVANLVERGLVYATDDGRWAEAK